MAGFEVFLNCSTRITATSHGIADVIARSNASRQVFHRPFSRHLSDVSAYRFRGLFQKNDRDETSFSVSSILLTGIEHNLYMLLT
jgi:hypothetical protein